MCFCECACLLVLAVLFDALGDPVDCVAGVFEFLIERFLVMMTVILECFHEVFWKVGSVMIWVCVLLDLVELFKQEAVVVFGCDGECLFVEPCGRPCECA